MLQDGAGRHLVEEPQDVEGIIDIGNVGFPRVFSHLEHVFLSDLAREASVKIEKPHIAENDVAVYQLINGRGLVRVFAVAQAPFNIAFLVGVEDVPDLLLVKQYLATHVDFDGVGKIVFDDLFVHLLKFEP